MSCAENGNEVKYVDNYCTLYSPVYLTEHEIQLIESGEMSLETAKMILANNKIYEENCLK